MKPAELRELNFRELTERLTESKEELFNLRFQLATNQLDNTARLKAVKKTVARIRTHSSSKGDRTLVYPAGGSRP